MEIPKGVVGSQAQGMHSVHWCQECAVSATPRKERDRQKRTEMRRYTDMSISAEAEGKGVQTEGESQSRKHSLGQREKLVKFTLPH